MGSNELQIEKLGMVGVGNMGGMMSLLFAERGVEVHFYDPSEQNVHVLRDHAKEAKVEKQIIHQKDYKELCDSLDKPKVFVFSIPHGIMDASNESWRNTERRQKRLDPKGIHFIGMGVSGGYQSARHGPSISPGGSSKAVDLVMPFLKKVAAKDKQGRPCTTKVGPGGSGHYVKMVHNGIEQGMMSIVCEVWSIMNRFLNMNYEEIANTFEEWVRSGPLSDNFLLAIAVDICRTKDEEGNYVLANVRDKVVQDVDETEGTGTWTCQEAVRLHVSAPTITAAHLFRLASADAARRIAVNKSFDGGFKGSLIQLESPHEKALPSFLEDLKQATHASFLLCFIQGLHIIEKASKEQNWNIDFPSLIQLWRGGCIIQSDSITDLLETAYTSSSTHEYLLASSHLSQTLKPLYPCLRNVVLKSLAADATVPALSAALEYLKYTTSTDLPTQLMEAELDYFGGHMFDLKTADPGKPVTGTHHFEWKPARGIFEDPKGT